MLQRLYVHNYRCLENFEFKPVEQSTALLLGKNGSGKSSVRHVLAIFQAIGRGQTRVRDLLETADFTRGRQDVPISFELEVLIGEQRYAYSLSLDLPENFRELRVKREALKVDEVFVYQRDLADVTVHRKDSREGAFSMDWHLVALPVVQDRAASSVLQKLRDWMSRMVLLAPLPPLMAGSTTSEAQPLKQDASNLVDWLATLLEGEPPAYATAVSYLQSVMPDLDLFRFERLGRDERALRVRFKSAQSSDEQPFERLSDGEKCFFLSAVLLAANQWAGPVFAFWDEPENFVAPHEVNQFIVTLKRNFLKHRGQLLVTSHNPQLIESFSVDSSWVLGRRSHLEPTLIRCLDELMGAGKHGEQPDLMQRLLAGDVDPWL